jgi:cytochrome c
MAFALAAMTAIGAGTMNSAQAQEACAITIDGTTYEPDLKKGKRSFLKCRACHTLAPGGRRLTGPNLGLVFERAPLGGEGFKYSKAFQDNPVDWDFDKLNSFIENPRAYMPGSKMLFAGIKAADERANLIAYLRQETNPEFSCDSEGR